MKITWVTRSFRDYRIPVYAALDELCNHELTVIYYSDACPQGAQAKLKAILGERAIARTNELRIGNGKKLDNATKMKSSIRIPLSPGLIHQVIKTRPEALVSDGFMQWTYAPLLVKAIKGIPHVMCYERTEHTERRAGTLRKQYRRFVSKWIDVIDCNGVLCGEYVKKLLGWKDNRLTYGHMVADVEGMKSDVKKVTEIQVAALREDLQVAGTVLLFVGQLIDRKGVMELLAAWNEFKSKCHVPCTMVFVGTGEKEKIMKDIIEIHNIPNVVMAGSVPYENIPVFYRMADCFILPTMEDNWSLVIPEAMACGLPVATTMYNGCHPELVTKRNGWLFDSMDKNDIVRTLDDIIGKRHQLKTMGENGRHIVEKYNAMNAAMGIMGAIHIAKKQK